MIILILFSISFLLANIGTKDKHIYVDISKFTKFMLMSHNAMTFGQTMKMEPPRVPEIASLELSITKNIVLNII